ncbi:uncharacterized protein [Nicotiana tomentosiformis]|uniref:uncharacterized protein n=1 Tax=Nicotiana tomentosiformis TaxID=4098 RepID=UPI00388C5D26
MRFLELAHYAIWLVPTKRERIGRFIDGLNYGLHFIMTREIVSGSKFDDVVDSARRLEQVCSEEREEKKAKRPRGWGGFSGVSSIGQSHRNRGHPYRLAHMAYQVHGGASVSHGFYSALSGQSSFNALPTP